VTKYRSLMSRNLNKREELFRDFEDHPGRLALATEIKDIDDQIAELNAGKEKARAYSQK
jgi:hypothetical protein